MSDRPATPTLPASSLASLGRPPEGKPRLPSLASLRSARPRAPTVLERPPQVTSRLTSPHLTSPPVPIHDDSKSSTTSPPSLGAAPAANTPSATYSAPKTAAAPAQSTRRTGRQTPSGTTARRGPARSSRTTARRRTRPGTATTRPRAPRRRAGPRAGRDASGVATDPRESPGEIAPEAAARQHPDEGRPARTPGV